MDSLWQMGVSNAVMAVVLALLAAGAALVRCRPALVHALWVLVLLKLLTPPLFDVPIPESLRPGPEVPAELALEESLVALPQPEAIASVTDPTGETEPVDEAGETAEPDQLPESLAMPPDETEEAAVPVVDSRPAEVDWPLILSSLWLVGAVLLGLVSLLQVVLFSRQLRQSRPAPESLQEQTNALARRLEITAPQVWLVHCKVSPMLWSLGKAKLVLPSELLDRLDDAQRSAILLHELAHFRRHDHWVRCLELLACCLFWWHPVVWIARRQMRNAEESCCDAWVVWALPHAARAYAHALLETIDFLSPPPRALPVASAAGQVPVLKRRLTMILQKQTPRRLSLVGILTICALGLALPAQPGWAQDETPRKRKIIKIEVEVDRNNQADPRRAEEVQKNRAELAKLQDEMARLQAKMRETQQRMAKVHRRLAELGAPDRRRPPRPAPSRTRPVPPDRPPAPPSPPRSVTRPVPPKPPRYAAPPDRERSREQALKEAAILKAQLLAKKSIVQEAEVLLDQAVARLERLKKLTEKGVETKTKLQQSLDEVEVLKLRLQAKHAELTEAETRLKYALMRADQLKAKSDAPRPRSESDRINALEKRMEDLLRSVEMLRKELKQK